RQGIAAQRLAVPAPVDAESGPDRPRRQGEEVAGDKGLSCILADCQILVQVGTDPRRGFGCDRAFAEQIDRNAALGTRIGVDAARIAVRSLFGVETFDQVPGVDFVSAPLVLLVLPVAETRLPPPAFRQFAAQSDPAA